MPVHATSAPMARLDRLGPAKELAQIGAAIGRDFAPAPIEAVAGKSQAELETALHRLISAGLLFREGVPPHANYLFKHTLVQDTAYSTLLREHRRALHEKRPPMRLKRGSPTSRKQATAGAVGAPLYRRGQFRRPPGSGRKPDTDRWSGRPCRKPPSNLPGHSSQIASMLRRGVLSREEIKLQVALITPLDALSRLRRIRNHVGLRCGRVR